MATIGGTALSLTDWAKRIDDQGKVADIIEILSKTNPILQDAIAVEGNLPTGHKSTVRTGLPTGTWRLLYGGVMPEKSTTAQVTDACGMLESYSEVDKALIELNGQDAAFRASEDVAFMEGMSQTVASTLFYGNTAVDPEKFTGLSPRFNSLSASNSRQIIDAGGSGSTNTSIWFVPWGKRTCHLIFPKGGMSGLQHRDLGQHTKVLSTGAMYEVMRSHFKWDLGLATPDWRFISRIANIETGDLDFSDASDSPGNASYTGPNIPMLLARAFNAFPAASPPPGTVIYCNRTVLTAIDLIVQGKANVWFTSGEWFGQPVVKYRGIPIRPCDALLNTETRVV